MVMARAPLAPVTSVVPALSSVPLIWIAVAVPLALITSVDASDVVVSKLVSLEKRSVPVLIKLKVRPAIC